MALQKRQYTKGTTPTGEALFPNLTKTESFTKDGITKDTGKYTIMLKLPKQQHEELLDKINREWEKYKETLPNKKFKYEISNGVKEYKDQEYFKFQMNAEIKTRTGETLRRTLPIFDTDCKEISKVVGNINSGSKVKVAYELVPFYMSDKNYGVSLRLTGVQIIELVEYQSQSAQSLGFNLEETGYKQGEVLEIEVQHEDDDTGLEDYLTRGDF